MTTRFLLPLALLFTASVFADAPATSTAPATAPATRPFDGVKLTLGYDTTRITSPLRADGTPDYYAAVEEAWKKGVTAENNAGPVLLAAHRGRYGYKAEVAAAEKEFGKLPATKVFPDDPRIVLRSYYFKARRPGDKTEFDTLADIENKRIRKTLWSDQSSPAMAAWLQSADGALDAVVDASKLPRFYLPMVRENSEAPLKEVPEDSASVVSTSSDYLLIRAMHRADEGDLAGACGDIGASYRLGWLANEGPSLYAKLVSGKVISATSVATRTLINANWADARAFRTLLGELDAKRPLVPMREVVSGLLRYENLDVIVTCARLGDDKADIYLDIEPGTPMPGDASRLSDYDRALRMLNGYFDRYDAAAAKVSYPERAAAMREFNGYMNEFIKEKAEDHWVERIVKHLVPSLERAHVYEAHLRAELQVTRAALALEIYRLDHKELPAKLDDLVPAILKSLPIDPFTDEPLVYKRTDNGYLLYSLGDNMKDDGGQFDRDKKLDDIAFERKIK